MIFESLILLHDYGTLPDFDNKFSSAARRTVRCSPQLIALIESKASFRKPMAGPDPVVALQHLLRVCFVSSEMLFVDSFSPYQFLCTGHLVIDLAFMRAVVAACRWLGPLGLPAGYIAEWPPPQETAGL